MAETSYATGLSKLTEMGGGSVPRVAGYCETFDFARTRIRIKHRLHRESSADAPFAAAVAESCRIGNIRKLALAPGLLLFIDENRSD